MSTNGSVGLGVGVEGVNVSLEGVAAAEKVNYKCKIIFNERLQTCNYYAGCNNIIDPFLEYFMLN